MQKNISFEKFNSLMSMLFMMTNLGLTEYTYSVTWEQRPGVIVDKHGNVELENSKETYAAVVEYSDLDVLMRFQRPPKTRFKISDV